MVERFQWHINCLISYDIKIRIRRSEVMYIQGISAIAKTMSNQINRSVQKVNMHQSRLSAGDVFKGRIDNPVDILRSSRLESQSRASKMAQRNLQDGLAYMEIKQQGITQMNDMGQRLNELSVQYQNSTLSDAERDVLKQEATSLVEGIENVLKNTKFNDKSVFQQENQVFQSGSSSGEKVTIKGNSFETIQKVALEERVELLSKTYSIQANVPGMAGVKGELKLDLRPDAKESNFTIKEGNTVHHGTLTFTDEKTGEFKLNFGGQVLKGKLNLNNSADKKNLQGVNTYTMNKEHGGWTANVNLSQLSSETKTIVETVERPVNMFNLSDMSIDDVLKGDFVEQNILSPITQISAQNAIESATFERRLNQAMDTEVFANAQYSRIREPDTAKEMMEMTKQQMLQDVNANLFSQELSNRRNLVLELLR